MIEPVLYLQRMCGQAGFLELRLHYPSCALGLLPGRGVDEECVVVPADGQALVLQLLCQFLRT